MGAQYVFAERPNWRKQLEFNSQIYLGREPECDPWRYVQYGTGGWLNVDLGKAVGRASQTFVSKASVEWWGQQTASVG